MKKLFLSLAILLCILAFSRLFLSRSGSIQVNLEKKTFYIKKVSGGLEEGFGYTLYNSYGKLIGTTFRLNPSTPDYFSATSTLITFYPPGSVYPENELFYFRPVTNELISAGRDCKNTPHDISYIEYSDPNVGFKISHPTDLLIEKGTGEPGMPYPYVVISGTRQWCPPIIAHAAIKIQKSDGFRHAQFGRVATEQDLEEFLIKHSNIIDIITLASGGRLFIVDESTPLIGRAVNKHGENFWLYLYTSHEHRWEIFKPMLATFDIIN